MTIQPETPPVPKPARKNDNRLALGFLKKQTGKTLTLAELQAGYQAHEKKMKSRTARQQQT